MDIEKMVNPFWGCIIKNLNYDALKGKVILMLQEPENGKDHKIIFYGVSLFLFLQNSENYFEEEIYHELSSITLKKEEIKYKKTNQKWLERYHLDFNVSFEDLDGTVLIKCKYIKVDEFKYILE